MSTTTSRGSLLRGVILLVPMVLAWGLAYPLIKLVSADASPLVISLFRVGVGAIFFLAAGRGVSAGTKQFVNGVIYFVVFMILLNLGTSISSSPGLAAVMMYTQPIFVIVFERALGSKLPPKTVLGVAIGFLGVVVSAASGVFDLGTLLTLIGGAVWAVGTVYYARYLQGENILKLNAFMSLTALPIVGALTPLNYHFTYTPKTLLILLTLSILAQALAYYLWFNAVKQLGSIKASAASLTTPAVAYALSYLLLHNTPTPIELAGSTITILGVYLALTAKNTQTTTSPQTHQ
ncbi:MAG: DMT family transporter [Thermoprotei archaeon]